jgi:ATP-dependent RNA helicase DDX47/RRP3
MSVVTKTDEDSDPDTNETNVKILSTFESLGVSPILCEAIKSLGWTAPTEIQQQSIPYALNGRDIIGKIYVDKILFQYYPI